MRCLVLGGGGREHALVAALARSPQVELILCAPGNPGVATVPRARCVSVSPLDFPALIRLAREEAIDLTVVGPEAPLVAGVVDAFRAAGLRILGPTAAAARLEGSKAFAKSLMAAAGVPTAAATAYERLDEALAALPDGPSVIKADGLAAGKGVVVADDRAAAEPAVRALLAAYGRVLIEERLVGPEVSVIALCDGQRAFCFPAARDHKRVGEGDTGPNTGGMGAIAPVPGPEVSRTILDPTLAEMARRGEPFRGFLFAGLMLTPNGPRTLEFNVRLGDPEAQVLLSLLDGDVAALLAAAADGDLAPVAAEWRFRPGAAACVVMASAGYPEQPRTGDRITGLPADAGSVRVFHAGTRLSPDGTLLTDGGRVLGVTATASTLSEALDACYATCARIHWAGAHFRRDIGRT